MAAAETDPNDPIATNRIDGWPKASEKDCDYVCLLETATGTALINKNMDVQTPPASLTKIMTTLLAIELGDLDDSVTMTETGTALAVSGSSNLYTEVGETFTLRDMLYGVMLASANDMATQVAEYIGGSVELFVDMMNERALELGCTGTHFENACGMPAEGHLSTAHDLALISAEALRNEVFREIVSTASYTIPATQIYAAREITNHHPCLSSPEEYGWEGVIGGKTGYTDAAMNCLATYVERDGRTLVCITLHGNGIGVCLLDTSEMITYGYKKWQLRTVKTAEGEELLDGGQVVTPGKKKLRQLDRSETVTETGAQREKVETVYSLGGIELGRCAVERPKAAAVAAPAAETAAASGGDQTAAGTGAGAAIQTGAPEAGAGDPSLQAAAAETGTADSPEANAAGTGALAGEGTLSASSQAALTDEARSAAAQEPAAGQDDGNELVRVVLFAAITLTTLILILIVLLLILRKERKSK